MKPEDRVRLFVFDKLRWCQEFETTGLVTPPKLHFTVLERLAAQIVTVQLDQVERIQNDVAVTATRVQFVE